MDATTRTPTPTMIGILTKAGLTAEANPELFGSFEAAWAKIGELRAESWAKPASEKSLGMITQSMLGAQLGWQPRVFPGAGQQFVSMQIDILRALDALDAADIDGNRTTKIVAYRKLLEVIRNSLTVDKPNDRRQRGGKPEADPAPF